MWWGLGQAEESEEGECACVDNPSRNRFMLTGRKREKQPTAGTTRQEAGIPALLAVLCNLKLWAPGPQAFQINDKELDQVACGDSLGWNNLPKVPKSGRAPSPWEEAALQGAGQGASKPRMEEEAPRDLVNNSISQTWAPVSGQPLAPCGPFTSLSLRLLTGKGGQ